MDKEIVTYMQAVIMNGKNVICLNVVDS